MKKIIFSFLILLLFFSCSSDKQKQPESSPAEAEPAQEENLSTEKISLENFDLVVEGDFSDFALSWEVQELQPGLESVKLILKTQKAASPPRFKVKWAIPSVEIYGFWTSSAFFGKAIHPEWSKSSRVSARASQEAPVLSLYNFADTNRLTFACSDALNKVVLGAGAHEETGNINCHFDFFTEKHPEIERYDVELRFDSRAKHFSKSLSEVAQWWASFDNYKPAKVPETARLPMYSTWYSFHQSLSVDKVLEQCRLAKEMGYEAVIVDDGWQTLDSQRGYDYTGDWKPERIPDMKGFVQKVHDLDMKFILWYSLPFVGEKSENYERFKEKFLRETWTPVLDPRFPEVREFIISTYEKALKQWNLDGFKLDFIDQFVPDENTVMQATDGRDFASVNQAVDKLMTDIMTRLKAINPDVLIEFRQRYIGPLMRKYGNMFRAGDCPNSAQTNRVRTTDVRLLCQNTAPHADMLMWHKNDPVEHAALQILNIIFTVPQLSVRIDEIPAEHVKMIKFWTKYWLENQKILLDGQFTPYKPTANYPYITARNDTAQITAIYEDMVLPVEWREGYKKIDIINAKISGSVIIKLPEKIGRVKIQVFDCMGNLIQDDKQRIASKVYSLDVPPSGLLRIQEKKGLF